MMEQSCEELLANQIFHNADVTVYRDECTSEMGDQVVTEAVADVRCLSLSLAKIHIAESDRVDSHFPITLRIHRKIDGVPITLKCTLESVVGGRLSSGCREGNYWVCYETDVMLG